MSYKRDVGASIEYAAMGIEQIADQYVEAMASHDPFLASEEGLLGYETEVTDYSPAAQVKDIVFRQEFLEHLEATPSTSASEQVAKEFMSREITAALNHLETGEELRALRSLGSQVDSLVGAFDTMQPSSSEDWAAFAERLSKAPSSVRSMRAALDEGIAQGLFASQRQTSATADRCEAYGGLEDPGYFSELIRREAGPSDLLESLDQAAADVESALLELANFLRTDYMEVALPEDGVGRNRYELACALHLGTVPDLDEAYEWGWEEFKRLEAEMVATANEISSGASIQEAVEILDADDEQAIFGEDNLRDWLQNLIDTTVADMNGKYFDIPDQILQVEAMIAPPGGSSAPYYTPPNEDFSRPGRTWYPTLGKTRFSVWREVSTCYHESVPGHHLQCALVLTMADRLNRHQRISFNPAHGEGWALYSERLIDELGYYEGNPGFRLGMLQASIFRAARVVVDIGMHLGLEIPEGSGFHDGEAWNASLGVEFLTQRAFEQEDASRSEIDRYLGLPAQAISYKLGERAWMEARAGVRERHGAAFDLKDFHQRALSLGPLGLEQFTTEMAKL